MIQYPRCAIGGLQTDLPGPLDLRRGGVPGPFALPEVEDPRGLGPLLRCLAPVPRRQACRPSARSARSSPARRRGPARPGGGSGRTASRAPCSVSEYCHQRPSMRATGALVLDGLPELLVDGPAPRQGSRLAVADAGQAEEVGRKLRAARVEDEGAAHPEGPAEQARLEDDVVARRGLTRCRGRGARRSALVQSSRANTNAAKSTWCASSSRRSSVVVPGLKDVVQGSTRATSSRPRVRACSSFSCCPDDPRKMRGFSIAGPRPPTWRRRAGCSGVRAGVQVASVFAFAI